MQPNGSGLDNYRSALSRPLIDHTGSKFTHNGCYVRVVLRRHLISVGCTDVTPNALRKLLAEYDTRFGSEEVVLQP